MCESIEIYPNFGKLEDYKILIFSNGKVFIDCYEYYPDLKGDVEDVKEIVNILERFIEAVKKYYNIQSTQNNVQEKVNK